MRRSLIGFYFCVVYLSWGNQSKHRYVSLLLFDWMAPGLYGCYVASTHQRFPTGAIKSVLPEHGTYVGTKFYCSGAVVTSYHYYLLKLVK